MADTSKNLQFEQKAKSAIKKIVELNKLPASPNDIFEFWSQSIANGPEGSKIVFDQMSQILKAVQGMDASKKEAFNQFTKEIADFMQQKFTADLIKANQAKVIDAIKMISTLATDTNIITVMTQKFQELAPLLLQRGLDVLKQKGTQMADNILPGGGALLNRFAAGASSVLGDPRAEAISGAIVATVKKFANINSLTDLVKQFKADDALGKVLDFSKNGNSNSLNLMYKAAETIGATGQVAAAVNKVATKIAEVAMTATQITYTLTEAAFQKPAAANAGAIPAATEALKTAVMAAAKSGEQPLQLSGGTEKQVLEICQAAVESGIKVQVNTLDPAIQAAVETASKANPQFKDFILEAANKVPTELRTVQPSKPGGG